MTLAEVQRVIADIEYKPGSQIAIINSTVYATGAFFNEKRYEPMAVLSIWTKDTDDQKTEGMFTNYRKLEPNILEKLKTPKDVLTLIRSLILEFELHEMDEWIRYKGEKVYNPHNKNTL